MNKFRIENFTIILIIALTLFTFAEAQDLAANSDISSKSPVSESFRAKELLDNKKFREAGSIIKELHESFPDDYEAQYLYLSLLRFVEPPEQIAGIIEKNLTKLENTPIDKRTENLYAPYLFALAIADKQDELSKATEEFMDKYPASLKNALFVYELIKNQEDSEKAVNMLDSFIEKFEKKDNLAADAARKRVVLISQNLTAFDEKTLLSAAKKLDELMYRRAETPDWKAAAKKDYVYYPYGIQAITDGMQETHPRASMEYAKKGLKYALDNQDNDELVGLYIPILKQSILFSHAKLEDWKSVTKTGEEILELLKSSQLVEEINEPKIRKTYADAAVKQGMIAQARKQLLIASIMNSTYETDLVSFNRSHPLAKDEYARFKKEIEDEYLEIQASREKKQKENLLKKQTSKKATDFSIKDLDGNEVSLSDYKGKVLFLGFWATWCVPCFEEMKEIQIAYDKYKNDPNVAFAYVCTDADKGNEKITKIVKENRYEFPIFYKNDEMKKQYDVSSYPRLVVIGPDGNIGFDNRGFINDGYFLKRLDWMIEALSN